MSSVVEMRLDQEIAILTLNRPERLNAWTAEMETAYFDLLDELGDADEVRVIVVTGAGRGFCAGADMEDLESLGAGVVPDGAHGDAKLTTAFARRGLVAEHGSSWILPRLVGPARALDLLLSGRVVLAEEALEFGLVNRVVPRESLLEETLAYAHDLAVNCSPASMATIKRQVYADLERPLRPALEAADELMLRSFAAPDFVEGVTSFVERREPRFAALAARAE
jgi:enoyl-CoA hydratase/carnithine racemase